MQVNIMRYENIPRVYIFKMFVREPFGGALLLLCLTIPYNIQHKTLCYIYLLYAKMLYILRLE